METSHAEPLSQPAPPAVPAAPPIPPLQNGDRLTREEFERRYHAMPHLKKAELIEGVVYVSSPVTVNHSDPHFDLITWLGQYRIYTPGVVGADNATLRLAAKNEPQPDAHLRLRPECGGQARVDADGYVQFAPELAAEVAASSASYDLHDKLNTYRIHNVREYLVWRTLDNALDWFVLRHGQYERLVPNASGWYQSEVLPGLWLDAPALLRGDMLTVSQVLHQGLQSPEHAAFVTRLQQTAAAQARP